MAKGLPVLIKRLKVGFTTISVAAFETVEIFRDLQECHMLVLKERPELEEEDGFYFDDLMGLMAKDQNGDLFGKVEGVFNFGAGDIVEVNLSTEKGKRMYPFSDEIVPEVNIDAGYIIINRDAFENTETNEKG